MSKSTAKGESMDGIKRYKKITPHLGHLAITLLLIGILATSGCIYQNQEDKTIMMPRGGVILTLEAKNAGSNNIGDGDLEKSREVIEARAKGIFDTGSSAYVRNKQIVVYIPLCSEPEDELSFLGKPWKLEFAPLDSFTDEATREMIDSRQFSSPFIEEDDAMESLVIPEGTYTPLMDGSNIVDVEVPPANSQYFEINITLDTKGTIAFFDETKALAKTQGKIVILLDRIVQLAPAVESEIPDGKVSITGEFSGKEARLWSAVLKNGFLDTEFEIVDYELVAPSSFNSQGY